MDFVFRRTYRGPLQAVILDWAGTTVDYGCMAPAVVFMEVFKRQGVGITIEEARAPMGAHKRVHIQKIAQDPGVAARWEATHGRRPTEDDVAAMFAEFVPLQLACLSDYADLIPGTVDACREFRARGLKIGSSSGYTEEMMRLLEAEATRRGYTPDATVCATMVPAGRPEPWMCFLNVQLLRVYPMEAVVKVGDTVPDIEEGLNAGMWTVGLAVTGNEFGLTEAEVAALPRHTYAYRRARAYARMEHAGAHYVVDAIGDVPAVLDDIQARLARGERP